MKRRFGTPIVLSYDILHKISPRASHFFQFVGECYVFGIMNGETFDSLDKKDLRDFCLV
jgi:hypothetical protein